MKNEAKPGGLGMLKVMTVFGTRPEAIKMAPLVRELAKDGGSVTNQVTVTAQHREMLDQVLDFFQIVPDYDLNIMQTRQSLTGITLRVLQGLEEILAIEKPDVVLVHGDTSTTMAASLAAFYQQIPVGHVEAGLRTGNKYAPYPEEMNRRITGAIADIHFAPTREAKENLLREGISPEKIFVTGNTAIDALLAVTKQQGTFSVPMLNELPFAEKKVIVVDAHRRENLGAPMENICRALGSLVAEHDELEIVFSVHRNPAVAEPVAAILGEVPRVHLVDPLGYVEWARLMEKSWLVISDSGGLQEEAPALGKPVLLLRDTTERPEAIKAGTVWMVGTEMAAIRGAVKELLLQPERYDTMAQAINPYGDGQASRRIREALLYSFQRQTQPPDEFSSPETAVT
jgi:UDP-N-acetylglucosamine 2-epimerase (non-hydrolysing)